MTRISAKSKQPGKPAKKNKKPPPTKDTAGVKLGVIILIAVLAGIPFVLGRYFEFNYPDPFDSAANVYSAKHILDGARIGIDERPSAALGTPISRMKRARNSANTPL